MLKFNFFLLLLSLRLCVTSQNLIPNHSFEDATLDTLSVLDFENNFTCKFWNSPNNGTPDYYTTKRIGNFGAPDNIAGKIKPQSGNSYAGIYLYGKPTYEYLQVKLTQKLIKDSYYCLTLFVSPPNKRYFTSNEIDFTLTKNQTHINNRDMIKDLPYQKIIALNGYFKMNCWNQVSAIYKAKGDEEFLILGMFNTTYSRTDLPKIKKAQCDELVYYIDNVSLMVTQDSLECKCNIITFFEDQLDDFSLAIDKPLILKNLNFEINKAILKPSSYSELKKLATYLKQNPSLKIEVVGYTDNVGSELSNLNLSKARAKTVADFLIKEKVLNTTITYRGLGSSTPIKPNDTDENKAENRRVEIKMIKI